MSEKILALLTARGVTIGGTFGGSPDLTPSEVARMLQGLERGPYLSCVVRDCGDIGRLPDLERCLWLRTIAMADPVDSHGRPLPKLSWPLSHGQGYCRRLAGLAVFEFLCPRSRKCEACDGRGWVTHQGQGVVCNECSTAPPDPRVTDETDQPGGTGFKSMSQEMRAEIAGIPLRSWKDGWSQRYEQVHTQIWEWHALAMSHLRTALNARRSAA